MATVALLVGFAASPLLAGEAAGREYAIKAAFLYNMASYVTWPAAAPGGADEPFVIGVLGTDPFGAMLDEIAATKTVEGRKIVVRRFRGLADLAPCHVLFLTATEAKHLEPVLQKVGASPVLLAADTQGAATRGVHVNFFIESNKVRFEVNAEAAQRAGLRLSSRLLRLARIVEPAKGGS